MRKRFTVGILPLLVLSLAAQQATPRELFERARVLEEGNRNLEDAVALYAQAAAQASDPELAATALLRVGVLHERLGRPAEAERTLRSLLSLYGEDSAAARAALARLRAFASAGALDTAMTWRRVWEGPRVDILGSVSPDARYLSFVDWRTGDLALHDLVSGTDRRLTSNDATRGISTYAEESAISRDGGQVAYSWFTGRARYELRTVSIHGGASRRLYENPDVSWIGPSDWSPDGRWIAVKANRIDGSAQIGLVSVEDGALRVLKSIGWQSLDRMFFSPDGKYLAYDLAVSTEDPRQHDLFILAVDGSREAVVAAHPAREMLAGWSPDGRRLLFGSDRGGTFGLWSVGVIDGRPSDDVAVIRGDIGRGWSLGVTTSGALYYGAMLGGEDVYVTTVDLETGATLAQPTHPILEYVGSNRLPQWSPDGKLLVSVSRRGPAPFGQGVVAILSMDTGRVVRELRPQLADFSQSVLPRWAPDSAAFALEGTDLKGRSGVFRVDVNDGGTSALALGESGEFLNGPAWSPDGAKLYYRRSKPPDGIPAIIERDLRTGAERDVVRRRSIGNVNLSPDGRWIVTPALDSSGEFVTLLLIPVAGGDPREIFQVRRPDRILYPSWAPDSSFVVARKEAWTGGRRPELDEFWRVSVATGEVRRLDLRLKPASSGWLSIHPDGRRVAYTGGESRAEVWVLENFLPAAPRLP